MAMQTQPRVSKTAGIIVEFVLRTVNLATYVELVHFARIATVNIPDHQQLFDHGKAPNRLWHQTAISSSLTHAKGRVRDCLSFKKMKSFVMTSKKSRQAFSAARNPILLGRSCDFSSSYAITG